MKNTEIIFNSIKKINDISNEDCEGWERMKADLSDVNLDEVNLYETN